MEPAYTDMYVDLIDVFTVKPSIISYKIVVPAYADMSVLSTFLGLSQVESLRRFWRQLMTNCLYQFIITVL